MLKVKYTLSTSPSGNEVKGQGEQEFESISELEHFIAYNRAYFLKLSFTGQFKREAN
jgi:hypothetical protein